MSVLYNKGFDKEYYLTQEALFLNQDHLTLEAGEVFAKEVFSGNLEQE